MRIHMCMAPLHWKNQAKVALPRWLRDGSVFESSMMATLPFLRHHSIMSGQPVEAAKKAAQDVKDKVEPGKSQVCSKFMASVFSLACIHMKMPRTMQTGEVIQEKIAKPDEKKR